MYGYCLTPLDRVIITEFSYWLWGHIFASNSKKKIKEWRFGIFSDSSLRNHCVRFIAVSTKKVRSIHSLALDMFSVEIIYYFRPRCHDQRRRELALAQKDLFSDAFSAPPSPSYRSNPTGTNTIEFPN